MPLIAQSTKLKSDIRSIHLLRYTFPSKKSNDCLALYSFIKRFLLILTNFILKKNRSWISFLVKDCKNNAQRAQIVWIKDHQGQVHIIPLKTITIYPDEEASLLNQIDNQSKEEEVAYQSPYDFQYELPDDTTHYFKLDSEYLENEKKSKHQRNQQNNHNNYNQFSKSSFYSHSPNNNNNKSESWKIFEFREDRFVWNEDLELFEVPSMDSLRILNDSLNRNYQGLDQHEHRRRLITFGPNTISAKKKKKWRKFAREMRRPIFVLPILCLIIWIFKSDWLVCTMTLIITLYSFSVSIKDFTPSNRVVKMLAKAYGNEIRVIRGGESFITGSSSLVPGDLIEINGRMTLPCDAILLRGSVECDEQQITGDPTPTVKYPATSKIREIVQNNLLIGGTNVRKVKAPQGSNVIAVVEKTGFQTMRGRLMKQILMARRMALSHKYMSDTHFMQKMMLYCGIITLIIFILYFIPNYKTLFNRGYYYYNFLDTLLVCCPPFLAIIYTTPLLTVKKSLKKKGFVIQNLYSILSFGSLDVVCFDKTNTLTQTQYELEGVIEVKDKKCSLPVSSISHLSMNTLSIMGSCNSLSIVDGKVHGDPMEKVLFENAGFTFIKETNDPNQLFVVSNNPNIKIKIIQVIPFNSRERKSSVLVFNTKPYYYAKGSVDAITSICKEESIPSNLSEIVRNYGMLGYRIMAFASKIIHKVDLDLEKESIHIKKLERDLEFNGLFLFQNLLVPHCAEEMKQLQNANIDTCIITGDSVYTTTAIAQKCNLISSENVVRYGQTKDISSFETIISWKPIKGDNYDHSVSDKDVSIAMNSDCLYVLRNGKDSARKRYIYNKLIRKCKIFSDILPAQKGELVQDFRDQDASICFVGDGSNDVFGISRANVGVSITNDLESNTSSFAAPIACDQGNGIPISFLIRQSRCVLENMVRAAEFSMIFFFIQIINLLHNNFSTFFSNSRVAWQIFQGFILTVALSRNKPLRKLKKGKPPTRILTLGFYISVFVHIIVHVITLTLVLEVLRSTGLYSISKSIKDIETKRYFSWWPKILPPHIDLEGHIIFLVSNFQLLSSAISIHFTSVHSHPLKNVAFFIIFCGLFIINVWLAFPFPYIQSGFFDILTKIYIPFEKLLYIKMVYDKDYEGTFLIFRVSTLPIFALASFILFIFEIIRRCFKTR